MSVVNPRLDINLNEFKAYYRTKPALIAYANHIGMGTRGWTRDRVDTIRARIAASPINARHLGIVATYIDLITKLREENPDVYAALIASGQRFGNPTPITTAQAIGRNTLFLSDMIRTIEPILYGNYIHFADVTYQWFMNNAPRVYPALPIRSKNAITPSFQEIIDALRYSVGNEDYVTDERKSEKSNLLQIIAVENVRTTPVTRNLSWDQRAHFGTQLSYVGMIANANVTITSPIASVEDTKTCAYDAVARDLSLTHDQIAARVGKPITAGLTAADMRKLFADANTTLYIFDLMLRPLGDGTFNNVVPVSERLHYDEGRNVCVYLLANQHVYIPDKHMRAILLKRTPEKVYRPEDEAKPIKAKDRIVIHATDFADAMAKAKQARNMKHGALEECKARHNAEIKQIAAELEAIRTPYNKNRRLIKQLSAPIKEREAAINAELDRVMQESKRMADVLVGVYVPVADMGREFTAHIHRTGDVYTSDIDRSRTVTRVDYAPGITIYANLELERLSQTAAELGIPYVNQTIASISRKAFATFAEKSGWETSTLNNAVRDILAKYPARPLNASFDVKLGPDEVAHGIDFYRNYATHARNGNFYTINLMAEITPYDMRAPSDSLPCIYYVETTDSILFAGNGVYDYKVVAAGIRHGVIKIDDIKGQVKATRSPTIDKTMRAFVDHIYATVTNSQSKKEVPNMVIGSMGSANEKTVAHSIITDNLEEASYYWHAMPCMPNDKVLVPFDEYGPAKVRKFWLTTGNTPTIKRTTDALVRMAIVQRARLAVFELMRMISARPNAKIAQIKTDAITYILPRDHAPYPTSAVPTFGDTRVEPVRQCAEWKHDPATTSAEQHEVKALHWFELEEISETEYFDARRLLKYKRAFVEGFAGSGKTHILRELSKIYESQGKRVKRCAFTHAAANLIDGDTMHHLFGINRNGDPCERLITSVMTDVDVILMDEMSMTPQAIYSIITQLPEHITIIGFGDFRQLQPIEEGQTIHLYRDTTMFRSLFGFNLIRLRKQCRSDAVAANQAVTFHDIAEEKSVTTAIRDGLLPNGTQTQCHLGRLPDRNICATNEHRHMINNYIASNQGMPISHMNQRVPVPMPREAGKRYTVEHFDARKLQYIIKNSATLPHIFTSSSTAPEKLVDMATRYLCNARDFDKPYASRPIEYFQSTRWYPDKCIGLSMFPRTIRHAIAGDYYTDIDCVNCGPTIFLHLTQAINGKHNPVMSYSRLIEYVQSRDNVIERVRRAMPEYDRDRIKKLINAVMLGDWDNFIKMKARRSTWMSQFKDDMIALHHYWETNFAEDMAAYAATRKPREQVKPKNNAAIDRARDIYLRIIRGEDVSDDDDDDEEVANVVREEHERSGVTSFIASQIFAAEARILDTMIEGMRRRGLLGANGNDYTMEFDGMMAPKNAAINDALLAELSAEIRAATNIDMRLKIKPMPTVKLPEILPLVDVNDEWLPYLDTRLWDEFPRLGAGMPVIANFTQKATRKRAGYFNSQRFTVKTIAASMVTIEDENKAVFELEEARLRRDFRPGYCVTAHKSQGSTITTKYAVHEITRMNCHGAYVAITRSERPADVTVVMPIE